MAQHLAQLNVGRLRGGKDDPHMVDFYANLDRINALAERMPGFVWRLKADGGNAVTMPADPGMALTLSVWESIETFETFVWQTAHAKIYQRKNEFFEKPTASAAPHLVMWWIEAGHIPTLAEAQARLDHLAAHGPSAHAFGWETAPAAKLWQAKRCA